MIREPDSEPVQSAHTAESSAAEPASSALNADTSGNGAGTAPIKKLLHEELTKSIIGGFYDVYNTFGYGFPEAVYTNALAIELRHRGHRVARELPVPVFYKGVQIAKYKLDFVVDDLVVVESTSTELLNPFDQRQLLNYLRATPFEVGLLLHFGPKPRFFRQITTHEPRR